MITHPYATAAYAHSLAHWGMPLEISPWDTSVIMREVDGMRDAAGVYPFGVLKSGDDIDGGIEYLRQSGLVSLVLVFDAFHCPAVSGLSAHFDFVRPFKTHYIYRKEKGSAPYGTHHRRALRHALGEVSVEPLDLKINAARWQSLYEEIIKKFNLTGLHAFPIAHVQALAGIEGISALGAWRGGKLISCHIWVSDGRFAHSHLVASNREGYDVQAAYAVNDFALRYFAQEEIINFGGGAGMGDDEGDGLARFKRGFSNDTAQSWLCGVVLDRRRYDTLCAGRGIPPGTSYFPAYRAPVAMPNPSRPKSLPL